MSDVRYILNGVDNYARKMQEILSIKMYLKGFSLQEIAKSSGLSVKSVKELLISGEDSKKYKFLDSEKLDNAYDISKICIDEDELVRAGDGIGDFSAKLDYISKFREIGIPLKNAIDISGLGYTAERLLKRKGILSEEEFREEREKPSLPKFDENFTTKEKAEVITKAYNEGLSLDFIRCIVGLDISRVKDILIENGLLEDENTLNNGSLKHKAIEEGKAIGREDGRLEVIDKVVANLFKLGFNINKIVEGTKLNINQIKDILLKHNLITNEMLEEAQDIKLITIDKSKLFEIGYNKSYWARIKNIVVKSFINGLTLSFVANSINLSIDQVKDILKENDLLDDESIISGETVIDESILEKMFRSEEKERIACEAYKSKLTIPCIAKLTDLSIDQVKDILRDNDLIIDDKKIRKDVIEEGKAIGREEAKVKANIEMVN